jgi:sugar phosphate isomerase/epimerase
MKPLGIQLYTLRDAMQGGNHLAILQELADIGYKGVEGHGFGMSPKEFRAVVEDMGMRVTSYFGANQAPETVNQFIEDAHELGVIDTVNGYGTEEFKTVDAIKRTAEIVNSVASTITSAGLSYNMHNHFWEFEVVDGRLAIEWLLDECRDVTLELDLYWCTNFGVNKAKDMAEKFKDRVKLVHVKDGPMVKDEPMTAAGSGKVDLADAIPVTNPNWLILELDFCATDMMEAVRQSYRYLVGNGLAVGNKPV